MSKPSCALMTAATLPALSESAETYAETLFDVRYVSRHSRSDMRVPEQLLTTLASGEIDYLFCFLSPVILPPNVFRAARTAAINFHPAPPRWPGVGSASYALYHGDLEFGATAHLIDEKVDSGKILEVSRFPICNDDTCASLFDRAQNYLLILFYEVCRKLLTQPGYLGRSPSEHWPRKAYTRAEFEKWMTLDANTSREEFERKLRAIRHPRFDGPYFEIYGKRFVLRAGPS